MPGKLTVKECSRREHSAVRNHDKFDLSQSGTDHFSVLHLSVRLMFLKEKLIRRTEPTDVAENFRNLGA
jgi:hypothetical protein